MEIVEISVLVKISLVEIALVVVVHVAAFSFGRSVDFLWFS